MKHLILAVMALAMITASVSNTATAAIPVKRAKVKLTARIL